MFTRRPRVEVAARLLKLGRRQRRDVAMASQQNVLVDGSTRERKMEKNEKTEVSLEEDHNSLLEKSSWGNFLGEEREELLGFSGKRKHICCKLSFRTISLVVCSVTHNISV
jgi:hypothetical protein